MEDLELEKKHLAWTLDEYEEIISDTDLKIRNLPNFYKGDYDKMMEEKARLLGKKDVIQRSMDKPYFARIDFEKASDKTKDVCYIGKVGVINYDKKIITVDWRAPIASLYYDSNIGKASYLAPEGEILGNLLTKRQYEIEKGELINFSDVDTVSNDELLKPYLGVSADKRLKNIVATIQSEQNKIIRWDMKDNLIVQGVAGSGKTTVALHRIAYLVYNNRDLYKPSRYMVIGPNKFFGDYIANILPDLDVHGVCQNTLEEMAIRYLNEDLKVYSSLKITDDGGRANYITSLDFKEVIDKYFRDYTDNLIPDRDLVYKGFKIVGYEKIRDIYTGINKETHRNLSVRCEKTIATLEREIIRYKDIILQRLLDKSLKEANIKKIKDRELLKKELGTGGSNILKSYFKKILKTPREIYAEIIRNEFSDEEKVKEILRGEVNIEDLTPLMYINYLLSGSLEFDKFKHVVIDEAQDYNTFTFYVLKKILKNASFSIYGDLAQSLYDYKSIKSWDQVRNVFGNCELLNLEKSYRTTIEIMNEANKINKYLGYLLAVPVIRHGEEVHYVKRMNIKNDIINIVSEMKNKGFQSIAIITKDQKKCDLIFELVCDKIDVKRVDDDLQFASSVCVLPSYLAKGLEFDAVIIPDVQDYDDNKTDMKLLYVSMTRALHVLNVLYDKEVPLVLR